MATINGRLDTMSTVFSTVLMASPPAFLIGWVLSKALFRQSVLSRSAVDTNLSASAAPTVANPAATGSIDQVAIKKMIAERQQAQQLVSQLRDQLGAAQQRLQPLQGEVQLLKEAVAEREHQVLDLRRKLQQQSTPPEVEVGAASIDTAKHRQLLKAMRDRLTAQEQLAGQQSAQLAVIQQRLKNALQRAQKWRLKSRPVLRQFRQQRTMISRLRDELRQRDLRQQNLEAAQAAQSIAQVTGQAIADQPISLSKAAESRVDYSSVNQENLQVLRGLGPILHKKLNERGIYRLGQIAELSAEESYRLCRSLGVGHKIAARNDWATSARELLGMTPQSVARPGAQSGVADLN
jgi:predicted flap endonuclease-1-like 5' DNA nuclease